MLRFLRRVVLGVLILGLGVYAAVRLSPWPSVLLIRTLFDSDATRAMAALAPQLPAGLTVHRDLAYDPGNDDLMLDVFIPPGPVPQGGWPVVVWVHGGAWVSGSKENVANYLRLMAGQGVVTIGVDYTLAPTAQHPVPVRQVTTALAWVQAQGAALGLNVTRVALAGDSAGAQIAAQVALVQVDADYAARLGVTAGMPATHLRGLVLFCGGFDLASINTDGAFGGFIRVILWSYFGTKTIADIPDAALFSIPGNLTPQLPPLFISAGNADPLLPQSLQLAEKATAMGLQVDTLFFPEDLTPGLNHEYQFDLASHEGKQAMARMMAFLRAVLQA
jgi:acetyl esterase